MSHRHGSIVSADGTEIHHRVYGRGPGVVLLHGGMQSAQNFDRLAEALATEFTVYVPDRRGRGRSGPWGDAYSLATESADVDALLRTTGTNRVFGLSSGALIALHAASNLEGIEKLAVYEPPLVDARDDAMAWVARYEHELDRGALAAAMVSAMQGTADEDLLARVPRVVLVPLVRLGLAVDRMTARNGHVPIAELVPTLRYDARLARETETVTAGLDAIRAETLLLGGDRSARFLRIAIDSLAARMPRARRVELRGIGHLAADDSGRPLEVAAILREFFH